MSQSSRHKVHQFQEDKLLDSKPPRRIPGLASMALSRPHSTKVSRAAKFISQLCTQGLQVNTWPCQGQSCQSPPWFKYTKSWRKPATNHYLPISSVPWNILWDTAWYSKFVSSKSLRTLCMALNMAYIERSCSVPGLGHSLNSNPSAPGGHQASFLPECSRRATICNPADLALHEQVDCDLSGSWFLAQSLIRSCRSCT